MVVYRIDRAKRRHQSLSGEGAKLYGGRWNFPGYRAVYCAGSRALAMLEMLVHLDLKYEMPEDRILLSIEIPEAVTIKTKEIRDFQDGWNDFLYHEHSQKIFGDFVKENQAAVLGVPSVIVPEEQNFILNPLHPDFSKIQLTETRILILDPRLFGIRQ